jgi:DNA-binding NtrC family response regulator
MGTPYTVLLAEDDLSVRGSLKETFLEYGFLVLEAGDIEQALETIANQKMDAVVLDMRMPDHLDGLRLLRTAFHFGLTNPAVPIIVFTGFESFDNCVESIKAGASDYLPKGKPDVNTLRELVRRCERLIENPQHPGKALDNKWLTTSHTSLTEKFGGKRIAVFTTALSAGSALPGAVEINGLSVVAADTFEELRDLVMSNPTVRDSLPFMALVPNNRMKQI